MKINEFFQNDTSSIVMEDIRSLGHIAPNSPEAFLVTLRRKLNVDAPLLAVEPEPNKR